MRHNYWSISKFADCIRGTEYPDYASSQEWRTLKQTAKTAHPLRVWLADTAIDAVQDFVMWPIDKLYSIKYWINNRYVTQTHALVSTLPKGQWYDLDYRIMHCLFDSLVEFVEVEQAQMHVAMDSAARDKFVAPFYAYGWFKWRTWRSDEAGIEYLTWASTLVYNEDMGIEKTNECYNQPTHQAKAAIEILELYNWWKNIRPNRIDPMDESGWSDICDEQRENKIDFLDFDYDNSNPEYKQRKTAALDLANELEAKHEAEDTDMLCRLIKIRSALWT